MKSRQQIKEDVLQDPKIIKVIDRTAKGNQKLLKKYKKQAGENFDEIAADYNIAYVELFHRMLTWF